MSLSDESQTLPIGSAAQALGVTRDNLYKHIERGRATINGVPFSAQQGPDKRWKVSIPVDLSPYLQQEEEPAEGDDETSPAEEVEALRNELAALRQEKESIQVELNAIRAERDAYKGMIEATHHATLATLERVVEKLSAPQLPPPEPPKKRPWWSFGGKKD
ncbi:MAG TPA: hypothetical protein VHV83_20035 [Armatimonadota bacterium]|nr:hypothetical protein [Armatimonadota bacterium]